MKTFRIEDMVRGWFVGEFSPTTYKTDACEVGYKHYEPNQKEDTHHHKIATEITVIVKGSVKMNGHIFKEGDIDVVEPNETVAFETLEETNNIVVKIPGVLDDKYLEEQ